MKSRIVVSRELTPAVMSRITREFDAELPPPEVMSPNAIMEALYATGAMGLVFDGRTRFDAAFVQALPPTLKVAATFSVGVDHVDLAAVRAKGLVLTNTPAVPDASVADFAFLLMLAAARRLAEYDATVRSGQWRRIFAHAECLGSDLAGKTLGILGMGRIGQALAHRARAFGMEVAYHNRTRLAPVDEQGAIYCRFLDELLPIAQVLSLHAPLTSQTAKLLNARTIGRLPDGAIVVNTARGGLIDDEALIAALRSGKLRAAGLDVFEGEPHLDPRYVTLPNVTLAPHMASATEETRTAMGMLCLDNIAAVAAGRPALTEVRMTSIPQPPLSTPSRR